MPYTGTHPGRHFNFNNEPDFVWNGEIRRGNILSSQEYKVKHPETNMFASCPEDKVADQGVLFQGVVKCGNGLVYCLFPGDYLFFKITDFSLHKVLPTPLRLQSVVDLARGRRLKDLELQDLRKKLTPEEFYEKFLETEFSDPRGQACIEKPIRLYLSNYDDWAMAVACATYEEAKLRMCDLAFNSCENLEQIGFVTV